MKTPNYYQKLIKELSFERLAGTAEESRAAEIISSWIIEAGLEPIIQEFPIDGYEIEKTTLFNTSSLKEYHVTGYGMSGSTEETGVTGEFVYIDSCNDVFLRDIKGKIVLVNNLTYKSYKKLVAASPLAFINICGSIYDDKPYDVNDNYLRERHYRNGKTPGVTMHFKEAIKLIEDNPAQLTLTLIQKESNKTSRNVITEIKGASRSETIVLTAHYDSVRFSSGAYDNATGSLTLLALLHHCLKNKIDRTIRFIWCGAEERGLLGSKAYCNDNCLDEIVYCINIDMTGVVIGRDIAVSTADNSLVSFLDYFAKEQGFPLESIQGVYSSDSTPFADKGIPSTSFARDAAKGGVQIHSRKDQPKYINSRFFIRTVTFIADYLTYLANSVYFPIPKSIPENMKEKLDEYLGRKD